MSNYSRDNILNRLFFGDEEISKELLESILEDSFYYIKNYYENKGIYLDYSKYFDVEIEFVELDKVVLRCNNILSALWFSNIFPDKNLDLIYIQNKYETKKEIITFNKKKKRLVGLNNEEFIEFN